MASIGIGIVGGGYMGKAHAVAMAAVGAVFNTELRPSLEVVCATTADSAERYRAAYGFRAATDDWRNLINDAAVEAVVIASPQETHRDIAIAALEAGKPVLCEKPLSTTAEDSEAMVAAAEASGLVNMVGFNYCKTPATQFARSLIEDGEIGDVVWFRGEHTEDFYSDPEAPASWRTEGAANGTMGDLAPHMIQCALALVGPIDQLCSEMRTVHAQRPSPSGPRSVTNDDVSQFMCRFRQGATGHLHFSRVASGRRMGYAYEVVGTHGAIRFDQEDQNAIWLYKATGDTARDGFRKILTGPAHPDYLPFCQGPGHGTGYQDQIIIQASHFLTAIAKGEKCWPDFQVGLDVQRIVAATYESHSTGRWCTVAR